MIDNVILIMTGALAGRSFTVLLSNLSCSLTCVDTLVAGIVRKLPSAWIFWFNREPSRCKRSSVSCSVCLTFFWRRFREIHRLVLVDSPISGYFTECLGHGSLDETRVEFIRNSVYKVKCLLRCLPFYIHVDNRCTWKISFPAATYFKENQKSFRVFWWVTELKCWLFDLTTYSQNLLYFEADRRVISISISSVDTEMSTSDKIRLFPKYGYLFPTGQMELASCTSLEKVKTVLAKYGSYCPYLSRFGAVEPGSFDKVSGSYLIFEPTLNIFRYFTMKRCSYPRKRLDASQDTPSLLLMWNFSSKSCEILCGFLNVLFNNKSCALMRGSFILEQEWQR